MNGLPHKRGRRELAVDRGWCSRFKVGRLQGPLVSWGGKRLNGMLAVAMNRARPVNRGQGEKRKHHEADREVSLVEPFA